MAMQPMLQGLVSVHRWLLIEPLPTLTAPKDSNLHPPTGSTYPFDPVDTHIKALSDCLTSQDRCRQPCQE